MMHRAVALLGGTFDPPHEGHRQLAQRALRDLPVSAVYLIPNGEPPHRGAPQTPWKVRMEWCRVLVRNIARARVLADEQPGAPRWTVHTVRRRKRFHKALILVLGADAYTGFYQWRQWRQILQMANIAVARRGHDGWSGAAVLARGRRVSSARQLSSGAGRVFLWRFRPADISATMLRRQAKKGAPLFCG